ncbi:MAG: hypothetical protein ACO1RX_03570 [Candidatus Sericytochromatia bacterium]
MLRPQFLSLLLVPLLLSACSTPYPMVPFPSSPSSSYGYGTGEMSEGSLTSLLTGQIVSTDEQQLRDLQQRKIVLDFPIKVGVITYRYTSKLDSADRKKVFDAFSESLQADGRVREVIQIPETLVNGQLSIEELRKIGARFQTDVLVLLSGDHTFERSRTQNLGFFDSFSDKAVYESQIKLQAITLDVFTGTLLSPFDVSLKADPITLDRANSAYSEQMYTYQQQAETKAWESLQTEAIARVRQLEADTQRALATPNPEGDTTP